MEEKKTFKEKIEDVKEAARKKLVDVTYFCRENKEVLVVIVPIVADVGANIVKILAKRKAVEDERHLKEDYIYDRSFGHYYELKRKPSASDWREIEYRKTKGESLGWILNDMRLLK